MAKLRTKCLLVLTVWLIATHFFGNLVAPGLSRIPYPQPLDLLVLALIPVGAFRAAKYDSTRIVFFLYGCLASSMFAYSFTRSQGRSGLHSAAEHYAAVFLSTAVVVGFGLLCRIAPEIRKKYDNWRRYPDDCCQRCGYNLTGNISGTCPECGTARRVQG